MKLVWLWGNLAKLVAASVAVSCLWIALNHFAGLPDWVMLAAMIVSGVVLGLALASIWPVCRFEEVKHKVRGR